MSNPVSYRQIAERSLNQAAQEMNGLPAGQSPTDVVIANAARAQAIATVAVAQALLEIGDVLRTALNGETS